jgi:hypothetical protein
MSARGVAAAELGEEKVVAHGCAHLGRVLEQQVGAVYGRRRLVRVGAPVLPDRRAWRYMLRHIMGS